jgi:hypothetical protein
MSYLPDRKRIITFTRDNFNLDTVKKVVANFVWDCRTLPPFTDLLKLQLGNGDGIGR